MKFTDTIKIGLIGFGTVGQGFYKILKNSALYQSGKIQIKIADIDHNKTKNLPVSEVASDPEYILDHETDIIVELIDNSEEAFRIATDTLLNGKKLITANKKMLAENIRFFAETKSIKENIYYEASVCGSIPIIKTIKDYYKYQSLTSIRGIVNGSCNYLLTTMEKEGLELSQALQKAQKNGFAESNPALDISGYDSACKAIILAYTAYGKTVNIDEVDIAGISDISLAEVKTAKKKGLYYRLIAETKIIDNDIEICVQPQLINEDDILSVIEYEYNCVEIKNPNIGIQVLAGKGAGAEPTGSAVFSDLVEAISSIKKPQYDNYHAISVH